MSAVAGAQHWPPWGQAGPRHSWGLRLGVQLVTGLRPHRQLPRKPGPIIDRNNAAKSSTDSCQALDTRTKSHHPHPLEVSKRVLNCIWSVLRPPRPHVCKVHFSALHTDSGNADQFLEVTVLCITRIVATWWLLLLSIKSVTNTQRNSPLTSDAHMHKDTQAWLLWLDSYLSRLQLKEIYIQCNAM